MAHRKTSKRSKTKTILRLADLENLATTHRPDRAGVANKPHGAATTIVANPRLNFTATAPFSLMPSTSSPFIVSNGSVENLHLALGIIPQAFGAECSHRLLPRTLEQLPTAALMPSFSRLPGSFMRQLRR